METSDSQLSEIIKQGKMNESQKEGNRTVDEMLQMFSQETAKRIENGEYILPDLSQGSARIIENDYKHDSMDQVRDMFEMEEDTESMDKFSFKNSILACEKSSSQLELKRRTNRIQDFERNGKVLRPEPTDDEVKEEVGKIMDQACDVITDSWKDNVPPNQSVSLLDISIESNDTVSQKVIDSQCEIDYLRRRTDEEQMMHALEKRHEKEMRASRMMEDNYNQQFEPIFPVQREDLQEQSMPEDQPIDYSDRDVFADEAEDEANKADIAMQIDQKGDENPRMELRINESRAKKTSDFAQNFAPTGESYLWAKAECDIPLETKWYVPPDLAAKPLALKVRFINYDKKMNVEVAMTSPLSDVKKCRSHIMKESEGVPAESFFYLNSPGAEWTCSVNVNKTGHYFRTVVPAGRDGMDFNIKFSCQEKCMDLSDKRKKMALVVFLEQENGLSITQALFREVRIVAYPRRDYRNFCEKSGTGAPKKVEFESPLPPTTTSSPFHLPTNSRFSPQFGMFNVTNNQMLPSTSSGRKRTATDLPYNFSKTMMAPVATSTPKSDHQRQLLLGKYGRGEDAPIESMDVQLFADENEQTSSKRSRTRHYPFRKVALPEEELESVAEFLANKAKTARSNAIRAANSRPHPLTYQEQMTPETGILIWLTTFNGNSSYPLFQAKGIQTLGDLINRFESDPEVLENIGIEPQNLKQVNEIFLNFYHVFFYQRLLQQKQQDEMHRRHYGL